MVKAPLESPGMIPVHTRYLQDVKGLLDLVLCERQTHPNKISFRVMYDRVTYRFTAMDPDDGPWWNGRRLVEYAPTIKDLSIPEFQAQQLMQLGKKKGLMLFCGMPGEGKSFSMAAFLVDIVKKYQLTAALIESPPELPLAGPYGQGFIWQFDAGAGDYQAKMEMLVRVRPSVVSPAEVISPMTASHAISTSLTGLLAVTTIHGQNPVAGLQRLIRLGAKEDGESARESIAEGLLAIVQQKLIVQNGLRPGDEPKLVPIMTIYEIGERADEPLRTLIRKGDNDTLTRAFQDLEQRTKNNYDDRGRDRAPPPRVPIEMSRDRLPTARPQSERPASDRPMGDRPVVDRR